MKTIQLTDEDYEALMEFSKELQTQENHHQAFPYFWETGSLRLETNANNEGEIKKIYDSYHCESYEPEEYAWEHEEIWQQFLIEECEMPVDTEYKQVDEQEWCDFLIDGNDDLRLYSEDFVFKTEHNPSLFLSDVQRHIKVNSHHLGRDPMTYARTIHRMPKMERLIEIIYRLNPQPEETVNHEAKRFVFKKEAV